MSSRDNRHEVVRAKSADLELSGYRGAFPPPEIIRSLNELVPDAADRILKMAEREQTHDHKIESRGQGWNGFAITIGQFFGFALGMATLGGSIWLMHKGNSITGFGTLLTGLAILVGAMVRGEPPKKT